jgi:ribosomal protein L11 methyltransferase
LRILKKSLAKISVATTPEAEDAVTFLLQELFGQPASVYVDARRPATIATVFPRRVSTTTLAALRERLRVLRATGLDVGAGRISITRMRPQDWAESWKRHFKPIEIGSALLLKPAWSRRKPKKNQQVVVLDPGLSFGTGQHPTTRFCLAQVVAARRCFCVQSFLDLGTGSGILAIAAAKVGYRPVRGIDSDPVSVRIAQSNCRQNGVGRKVRLSCQDLARLPIAVPVTKKYDLICANLTADLLLGQRRRIVGQLKAGGRLVLAGILRSEFAQVGAAYAKSGLRLVSRGAKKEWASGAFISSPRQKAVQFRTR